MYKAAIRMLIRRNIRLLNEGRHEPSLAMFASDATLVFPGDNSWARMYREPHPSEAPFVTHRGTAEIAAFLQRFVAHGIQMHVDDILVNGPPWNTRAAVRVHHGIVDEHGNETYSNRAVLMVRTTWGKVREQEDYEDTERVAAFDARVTETSA